MVVFENNGFLNIASTQEIASIKIFDIQGRNIFESKNINAKSTILNGFRPQQQVLILQNTSANHETVTKKVIF